MAYAGEYDTTYTEGGDPAVYGTNDPSHPPPGFQWDARTGTFIPVDWFAVNGPTPAPSAPGETNIVAPPPPIVENPPGYVPPAPAPTQYGVPTSGFGSAPAPYASNADAPQYTPMETYRPPTWQGGDFRNPTEEELYASPGYKARLDRRLQGESRRFASQGTILNGGTLKALDRSAQDYATGEYQTLRNNAYDTYVQKYKQFTDAAGMDLGARTINANENQQTFQNRTQTYQTGNNRTLTDYLTNLTAQRNSELDYWNRLQDVNQSGLSAATGSR